MPCEHCIDPDGEPCYPTYGLAPHKSFEGSVVVSSEFEPESEWPEEFTPDEDDPKFGVWSCPKCGHGKPDGNSHGSKKHGI